MKRSAVRHSGAWILSGLFVVMVLGGPAVAADITGACCLHDGSCLVLTQSDCLAQQGVWEGPGTSCTPNPCPCILELCIGACCLADGTCVLLDQYNCQNEGGTYQGIDTVCDPNPCKGPSSAPEPGSAQHSWGKIKSIYR